VTVAVLDRPFAVFGRGEMREELMTSFRVGLRQVINPETGLPFAETDIAIATSKLSAWWLEADALDIVMFASSQARAQWLADQADPLRASTEWLERFHLRMWREGKLLAAGGSGQATTAAAAGTPWPGSTTIGDPVATVGRDPAGKRYQVLFGVITPGSGVATLTLAGIDTGDETNLPIGTVISWENAPLGSSGDGTVTVAFTGGAPAEDDAAAAKRLLGRIRHKPAAGNNAHFRSWARDASVSVEDACVFACAFNAGSTLIVPVQKRVNALGPTVRVASAGTLAAVTAYVTPPGSPVAPTPPHVVVTPAVSAPTDMVLSLAMPKGRSSGWEDLQPWPAQSAGTGAVVTVVTDQQHFRISCPVALPTGVTAPKLMIWDKTQSRFTQLLVTSVVAAGAGLFDVVLSAPPTAPLVRAGQSAVQTVITVGDGISPYSRRLLVMAEAIEGFFDSLGPGEVVDLATDLRAHRAFRWPEPSEELPQRAGASVLSWLRDALGSALADSNLESNSNPTPAVPADPIAGPTMITVGRVGVYALN
jgi:uncharacterized phage protein gp47/JayE